MSTDHNSENEMCEMISSLLINNLTTTEDLEKMGFTETEIKDAVHFNMKGECPNIENSVQIEELRNQNEGQEESKTNENCELLCNNLADKGEKIENLENYENKMQITKRCANNLNGSSSMQSKRVRPMFMHNEYINNQEIEESKTYGSKTENFVKKQNNTIASEVYKKVTTKNDALQFTGLDLCVIRDIAESITECDDPKQATWECLRQKQTHENVRPNDDDDDAEGGGALVLRNLNLV